MVGPQQQRHQQACAGRRPPRRSSRPAARRSAPPRRPAALPPRRVGLPRGATSLVEPVCPRYSTGPAQPAARCRRAMVVGRKVIHGGHCTYNRHRKGARSKRQAGAAFDATRPVLILQALFAELSVPSSARVAPTHLWEASVVRTRLLSTPPLTPDFDTDSISCAPTSSAAWRWTAYRRPTPAIPACRWAWPTWPTCCGPASCATTRPTRMVQPRPLRALGRPRLDAALQPAAPGRL